MAEQEKDPFYHFCDELEEKTKHFNIPPLLFRGQSDKDWEITSTLLRPLIDDGSSSQHGSPKLIKEEVEQIIDACKLREASYPAIKGMSELELLAEIQHMGGKTPLIDFTLNTLTALYFACASSPKKDGAIYALYPFYHSNIQRLPVSANDTWAHIASGALNHLFYWQPARTNHRIIKQDSMFVFSSAGKITKADIEFEIIIKAEDKEHILQRLRKLAHIDFDSVYPDFLGYLKGGQQ